MSDHVRAYKTFFTSPPLYLFLILFVSHELWPFSFYRGLLCIAQVRSHFFFTIPVSALLNVCIAQPCSRGERTANTCLEKTEIQGVML